MNQEEEWRVMRARRRRGWKKRKGGGGGDEREGGGLEVRRGTTGEVEKVEEEKMEVKNGRAQLMVRAEVVVMMVE